jgi:hypothetical protein
MCASDRSLVLSVKPTLSRTPVSKGRRPVSIVACDGSVDGECE